MNLLRRRLPFLSRQNQLYFTHLNVDVYVILANAIMYVDVYLIAKEIRCRRLRLFSESFLGAYIHVDVYVYVFIRKIEM